VSPEQISLYLAITALSELQAVSISIAEYLRVLTLLLLLLLLLLLVIACGVVEGREWANLYWQYARLPPFHDP
jgi:uncharacterized Tic20 family protein